jgi:hypothetical protein
MEQPRRIAWQCVLIIAALYVVGLVGGTVFRHAAQTAPLWLGIFLGWRRNPLARWIALPMFLFWIVVMVLIWLFLLGWARVVHGTFSPMEIAMTLVIGFASLAGVVSALGRQAPTSRLSAAGAFLLGAALQVAAFRVSMLPGISNR